MIRVRIDRDETGRVEGYHVEGHAGFGPRGRDIVCAGVSALVEATALGLQQVAMVPVKLETAKGKLACVIAPEAPPESRNRAQLLLGTMILGIRQIAAVYPKHIKVEDTGGKKGIGGAEV